MVWQRLISQWPAPKLKFPGIKFLRIFTKRLFFLMKRFITGFLLMLHSAAFSAAAVRFAWTDVNLPVEGRRYAYAGTMGSDTSGSRQVEVTREYANVQATPGGLRFEVTTAVRILSTGAVLQYVDTRELTAAGETLSRRVSSGSTLFGSDNITYAAVPVAPREFEVGQRYDYSNLFAGSASGREERAVTASAIESLTLGIGVVQTAKIQTTVRNATGTVPAFQYGETGWYARGVGPVRLQLTTTLRETIDVYLVSANFPLVPQFFDGAGPQITAEPESLAVGSGETARFRVVAVGEGLTYAWTRDGTPIPGATAATLVLPSVAAADAAVYRVTVTGGGVAVQSKMARLSVATTVAGQRGDLANLSVRAYAADGGAQLIAGMSIQGATTAHRMLIRGLGPGLGSFGVPGAAKDTSLAIRGANGAVLAENDDWGRSANAASLRTAMMEVGAFAIPDNSKDSVVIVPLATGNYTALVRDAAGGIGLVECYDADAALAGGFSNLSARADVRAEPLIAGMVVSGGGTMRLLVRAVGPTLGGFGVTDAHANPTLRVVASSGADIATNDDWSNSAQKEELRAAIAAVGAFPLGETSRDAALIVTVSAGSFTAVVDASPFGGIALVEVYRLSSSP